MTILKNLFTPSRVGFLLAALAATTMSFSSLDAMKRKFNHTIKQVNLDMVKHEKNIRALNHMQQQSAFEQGLLQDINVYILSLSFDCSSKENLLASIKKLRSSCLTNLKAFALAFENCLKNNETLEQNSLISACAHDDVDSLMIILGSSESRRWKLITKLGHYLFEDLDHHPTITCGIMYQASPENCTLLHYASKKSSVDIIKTILKAADKKSLKLIAMTNSYGENALHRAANACFQSTECRTEHERFWKCPRTECCTDNAHNVLAIIDGTKDNAVSVLFMRDNENRTPLDCALVCGTHYKEKVLKILEAAGSNAWKLITLKNRNGQSTLDRIKFDWKKSQKLDLMQPFAQAYLKHLARQVMGFETSDLAEGSYNFL